MIPSDTRRVQSSPTTLQAEQSTLVVPGWGWLFAAGPAVWSVYFGMEARAAGIGCPVDTGSLVVLATLALGGLIMVTMAYTAGKTMPPSRHARHPAPAVMRDGFLLGAALLAASVLVVLPALLSHPC